MSLTRMRAPSRASSIVKRPGARADFEHPVAGTHPPVLKPFMKFQIYAARDVAIEAIPFGLAVLIEEVANATG